MSFWSCTPGWRALLWVTALSCLPQAQAAGSGSQQHPHIEVELVAESRQAVPGGTLPIALRLLPQAGWHTYWRNPGDSGLETRIRWDLPPGVHAGEIQWPTPQRLPVEHLVNYGMEGETWLISDLQLPADLPLDRPLEILASAAWLVCEIECIPGFADFQLSLPVVARDAEPAAEHAAGFVAARQRLPVAAPWPARFSSEGGVLRLVIEPPPAVLAGMQRVYFFPASAALVDHSKPQTLERSADAFSLTHAFGPLYREPPERLDGVLRVETQAGTQGYELVAHLSRVAAGGDVAVPGLVLTLGLALLGGLLLNLMPCVFPVLSLKALSLAQGAGQARREQALHGISYTLGILASFGLVAGLLLFLRAGGVAIGWGFQLQSPLFIGLLAMLMFALALSLSGLIDFGTRLMGIGQQLTVRGGYRGSFFTGVLATLVASPCTAPFMGVALGIAVLQPPFTALVIFLTLGLGMALPFLLLGLLPVLGRWLPRPGAWMETFKQAMAFPLYLTVVWLLWVLGRQAGVDAMAAVALGLVALALALWLWGRAPGRRPWLRHGLAGLLVVLALATLRLPGEMAAPTPMAGKETPGQETFSAERLAALRADGRAVFVNMTADWCITCMVNEQLALNTSAVQRAFAQHEVAYLQGDWTRHDPAITAYLARYGRNGVPHYVVYLPGQEGRVLPQVLTAGLVVEALDGR